MARPSEKTPGEHYIEALEALEIVQAKLQQSSVALGKAVRTLKKSSTAKVTEPKPAA